MVEALNDTRANLRIRAQELFEQDRDALYRRTDRLFAGLMVFQWIGAIAMAVAVSPRTWIGEASSVHIHIWTAIVLGGLLTAFPVLLVAVQPGRTATRHVIAISQTLFSAMLIHLSGGRIETHFHVFGSLAFLAFYRDWRVLLTATVIIAADHFLRGMFWPQSVFGVLTSSNWRWLEHAAWVIFEDVILVASCRQGVGEMRKVAQRHAELEATNEIIDAEVRIRTSELAEARENLERVVEERTSDLLEALACVQRTNVRLEEANRHKSHFLSTMSHELRTPLNAIIGFADLLEGEGFGPLNEKQKKYVRRIDDSGAHLLELINDVLDLTKIEMGAMELTLESVGVEELLQSASLMVAPQAEKKSVRMEVRVTGGDHAVRADRRRARQILLNFLSNALKYAPPDSAVTLTAVPTADGKVRMAVSDHGVGIDESKQEQIFEEFQQADRERDEALGGIGLGLALTKRLVELHGGEIGVNSALGEGSTFWFTMPSASAPAVSEIKPQEPRRQRADGGGVRILVAEDNEANMMMLTEILSLRGYEVVTAKNGQECVDLARECHPDMIITDMRMPVKDGLEAVRELRFEAAFAELPIIALTANASEVSREACLEAGCTIHLTKPIKSGELFPAMDALFDARNGAAAR
jgi:signal transduction histidine kinase/ActR/RegA family two-component response regulator